MRGRVHIRQRHLHGTTVRVGVASTTPAPLMVAHQSTHSGSLSSLKQAPMGHVAIGDSNATPVDSDMNDDDDDDGSKLRGCRAWLGRLSTQDVRRLQRTDELRNFLVAFQRLEQRYRGMSLTGVADGSYPSPSLLDRNNLSHVDVDSIGDCHRGRPSCGTSQLQSSLADELVLKVLDFLDSQALAPLARTCARLRALARRSAGRRAADLTRVRQLPGPLALLRAREQLQGLGLSPRDRSVPLPVLLLRRRVRVTGCGDTEFNGVYHCTGCNGNGFIFTKPRDPVQWIDDVDFSRILLSDDLSNMSLDSSRLRDFESDSSAEGAPLRCILAKRFSSETILWYMSKEVLVTENNADDNSIEAEPGDIIQVFCFWANLMITGDATPDICRYPSQSSILQRNGEGWQALETTQDVDRPIVELLD